MSAAPDDPLARFWDWLNSRLDSEREPPRRRQVHEGDTVTITVNGLPIGRYPVLSATKRHFKLADGRVFDQRGWSVWSGPKGRVRAWKARR